jgi:alpha-tubulin suppressor-like RCC1 family protein
MEIEAATRAIGAAALRDAKMQRVKEDLRQLRSYVQSVVATTAWGNNGYGQLGDGTKVSPRLVPVQVSGLPGPRPMAAGFSHSVGLRGDGKVSTWGRSFAGQLGNGTTQDASAPSGLAQP